MRAFAKLFQNIDQTTKTSEKIHHLSSYFASEIDDVDKLWTVAIFSHRRPPKAINSTMLREWTAEIADIPLWLFEDTYHIVGDLAETMSLLAPVSQKQINLKLSACIQEILAMKKYSDLDKKQRLFELWSMMTTEERFLFNKLLTGGFRVGVSQNLITKALAIALKQEESKMAHKLMGDWSPSNTTWKDLLIKDDMSSDLSKPYPFYLAYALEGEVTELGNPQDWAVEYKWDGIRGMLIIRDQTLFVWSRGEELVTDKFPEFKSLSALDYNVVIDGEIVIKKNNMLGSFNDLQIRIGRKSVSAKVKEQAPVAMIAYDILEYRGKDVRHKTYADRRKILSSIVTDLNSDIISLSEHFVFETWAKVAEQREQAPAMGAEGLMLKKLDSQYQDGRKRGDWWKWKVDPFTVDAVMIYAQRGHGRRANLYTDFTFAVWQNGVLVPFAKAYSGLTDAEFREVTDFVKNNTIQRFGPVTSVTPSLVFELAFEGIARSQRHKSGIAVRFPRIKSWRKDKKAEEADNIENLLALLL